MARLTAEEKRRNQTQARVGLASNVIGLGAGGAAVHQALKEPALRRKVGHIEKPKAYKITGKTKAIAGGLLGLQVANIGGDIVANRVLARNAGVEKKPVKKDYTVETITDIFISKSDHTTGHGVSDVEKAHRRYDPEADRQRRLGLTAGAGAAGGAVLGGEAIRRSTVKLSDINGKPVKGVAFKHGKGRAGALLALGAAGSTGLGLSAYRKGVSERNNPWN